MCTRLGASRQASVVYGLLDAGGDSTWKGLTSRLLSGKTLLEDLFKWAGPLTQDQDVYRAFGNHPALFEAGV